VQHREAENRKKRAYRGKVEDEYEGSHEQRQMRPCGAGKRKTETPEKGRRMRNEKKRANPRNTEGQI
jgi:hypothetical protein